MSAHISPQPPPPSASPRPHGAQARPGFAMFMALGALVIIAALVAGSSFITLQETHLGQNSLVQSRAFAVAEYGLNMIQSEWNREPNLAMDIGASEDAQYSTGQDVASVRITRLNNETFWIVSEGRSTLGTSISGPRSATKRIGAILRLRTATVMANAAVTSGGTVNATGKASVSGADVTPAGFGGEGCSPPGDDRPGILVPEGETVETGGASDVSSWETSAEAGDASTYIKYGEETWHSLVEQANITITGSGTASPSQNPGPVEASGACNKTLDYNWGEPWRDPPPKSGATLVPECNNYTPIIHVHGPTVDGVREPVTLQVQHGRGQGILLIEGNLKITGNFYWYGLMVVTGSIINGAGTPFIYGAVMAAANLIDDPDIGTGEDGSSLSGTISYQFSGCALERALRGAAQVQQAKERAWAELY